MLNLKAYQQRVLDELEGFLTTALSLQGERGIRLAFLDRQGENVTAYRPIAGLESTPYLCVKVPTAGGKTLIASNSLQVLFDRYLLNKNGKGIVLWFTPSDQIRTQTLANLRNRNHPYRQSLDVAFHNAVEVLDIEEALSLQASVVQDNLCIIVASLAAFRRTDKTWLKVFQNNGSLLTHFEGVDDETRLLARDENGDIVYSLGNVLRLHRPAVIIDEGHNAQTSLSLDMLRDLAPSIILEYTATPREQSNVLIEVSATELKAEKMVKMPIYLTNVAQWQEAIRDGIAERNRLETLAMKEKRETGEYIRPIVLIQAEQEKVHETRIYVDKARQFLIEELNIDPEEIAIKTATRDELVGIDLLSARCPIRYILTVNALREGWDCPFAYVLVSVANLGSSLSVEQTIGRILRLPSVKEKSHADLNYSYVYTSSETFSKASNSVIKGLEANGYSRDDLKVRTKDPVLEKKQFARGITSETIQIPMIGIRSTGLPISFNRDLVGSDFRPYEYANTVAVDFQSDQYRRVKIDIDAEGISRTVQGKLNLAYDEGDFSVVELCGWLKRHLRHSAVSSQEMGRFIDVVVSRLLREHDIVSLSVNRYWLKEQIAQNLMTLLNAQARERFDRLVDQGEVTTQHAFFTLPEIISLANPCPELFHKHLFERAAMMNGEELDFAFRLDALDSIVWWYRNREKEDFYLQGWRVGRFYPDFIALLNSGSYALIEYKGSDRISNEDTIYKQRIGEFWEMLNTENGHFYLVGQHSADALVRELEMI